MNIRSTLSWVAAGLLFAAPAIGDETRINASRDAVKALGGTLQGELKKAMEEGGPLNAIKVCNSTAPSVAREISRAKNMRVGRTSLKIRNESNAPDAWEKQVLESFEARKAKGEDPAKLEYSAVVGNEFRYMKAIAIPADAPCLKCHGEKLDDKVAAKIKELYPRDQATGFRTGDLRGAFTVRQKM